MDSTNWSAERKASAGRGFASQLAKLAKSREFRSQRRGSAVAAHLSVAVAKSGLSRAAIADRAGMKAAQLSRQLSGGVNLTLESVGRICEAAGWDFDIVLRRANEPSALQPWERQSVNRAVLLSVVRAQQQAGAAEGNISHAQSTFDVAAVLPVAANDKAVPLDLEQAA